MRLVIFIWSETKWNGNMFFLFIFFYMYIYLTLVKWSQSTKPFDWKWFSLVFYSLISSTKWQNWLVTSVFASYLPVCINSWNRIGRTFQYFWRSNKMYVHMQEIWKNYYWFRGPSHVRFCPGVKLPCLWIHFCKWSHVLLEVKFQPGVISRRS